MSPKENPDIPNKGACGMEGSGKGTCDIHICEDDNLVTKMLILGPSADISQSELVQNLHMMELPLTIKGTCYGAIIYGEKEFVDEAVSKARKLDAYNLFIKDRGFPPGDPRRCRGHRGAAREGYHQLEKEFKLLGYVGEALKKPQKVSIKEPKKVSVDAFREIAKETPSKSSKIKDEAEK